MNSANPLRRSTHLKLVSSSEEYSRSPSPQDLISDLPHTRLRECPEGAVLFQQGDTATSLYRLSSGLVKLVTYKPDGSTRIIRVCSAGNLIGMEGLFNAKYHYTAIALSSVSAVECPISDIQQQEKHDIQFYFQLTEELYDQLSLADKWISDFSSGSIKQRIVKLLEYLTSIKQSQSSRLIELLKVQDIADIVAATPESVSRILADFKRREILVKSSGALMDVYIIDFHKLNASTVM